MVGLTGRLAGLLILGSVPTAFAGAFIVEAVDVGEAGQDTFLSYAVGAALVLTAVT